MDKKKLPIISIVFYVLAALSLAYGVWALIYSSGIVSEAIAMGQLVVKGSEFEVVSYYMSSISQYLFFAAVFIGLGWALQILSTPEVLSFEEVITEIDLDETPVEGLQEDEDEEEESEE